ncbi:hypothetical protein CEXT_86501 [Caerostris extrusa]|uniref:Uncharacterized protein n=1 Tax=Caerostris extrusa TaxID=172846 RepID=A0AAV4SQJ7_CAEEX|nr:hypothetical protein CEXT_86501 [Caerostris extrusa]
MKWSRSTTGGHTEVVPNYRSPRRPQYPFPQPQNLGLRRQEAQETYICCAYSPRCFIIQKGGDGSLTYGPVWDGTTGMVVQ